MDTGFEPSTYRSLSVIVPVFNERNTVAEILRRMRAVTLPRDLELEVVVVDDGSSDGSAAIAAALSSSFRTPTSSMTPTIGPGFWIPYSRARHRLSTAADSQVSGRTCFPRIGWAIAS